MEDEEGILTPRPLLTSPSLGGGAAGAGGSWSWCHRWARDSCHRDMSRFTWVTGKCYCHESHVWSLNKLNLIAIKLLIQSVIAGVGSRVGKKLVLSQKI